MTLWKTALLRLRLGPSRRRVERAVADLAAACHEPVSRRVGVRAQRMRPAMLRGYARAITHAVTARKAYALLAPLHLDPRQRREAVGRATAAVADWIARNRRRNAGRRTRRAA